MNKEMIDIELTLGVNEKGELVILQVKEVTPKND